MAGITKAERASRAKQREINRAITGGYDYNRLYFEDDQAFMFVEDAECDPCKVLFGYDGAVTFSSNEFSYAMLTEKHLRHIVNSIKYAVAMYEYD
ncbi:MAG: hypothetical protein GY820_16070 [Gammaproteobacteria bacterium]|nr:hypothetical protein [Gammaproteobacteria bacterium]